MRTLTKDKQTALEQNITKLEEILTGDMFADMNIKDEIHNLKMKLEGIRPANSEVDCVGCGS